MRSASRTDKGKVRNSNQDYFFISDKPIGNLPNLYIVADGMGGHNAGEFASSFGTDEVRKSIEANPSSDIDEILGEALKTGNGSLYDAAKCDTEKIGCGTTMVAAVIDGGTLHVYNVGDSRLYLVTKSSITQITRDHSVVEEMISRGLITREEAFIHPDRHKITRAFGIEPQIRWDSFRADLESGDTLLLCTDGVTNMVSDEELYQILSSDDDPVQKVDTILDMANDHGGADNITAIVVQI